MPTSGMNVTLGNIFILIVKINLQCIRYFLFNDFYKSIFSKNVLFTPQLSRIVTMYRTPIPYIQIH